MLHGVITRSLIKTKQKDPLNNYLACWINIWSDHVLVFCFVLKPFSCPVRIDMGDWVLKPVSTHLSSSWTICFNGTNKRKQNKTILQFSRLIALVAEHFFTYLSQLVYFLNKTILLCITSKRFLLQVLSQCLSIVRAYNSPASPAYPVIRMWFLDMLVFPETLVLTHLPQICFWVKCMYSGRRDLLRGQIQRDCEQFKEKQCCAVT